MKYDKQTTLELAQFHAEGMSPGQLAEALEVPLKSIVAKLSSMGLYQKKPYLTKRGELPVRKSEYIERISDILEVDSELLESLEKVNKNVLAMLEAALRK